MLTDIRHWEDGCTRDPRPTQELDVYSFASEYFDRGYSIVPLSGSWPAIRNWREYHRRRPTLDDIRGWFGGANPEYKGVGILTGRTSGLVVVKCEGEEAVTYWQSNYETSPLVVAIESSTHFYYQAPGTRKIRNRLRIHGHQINVSGEFGFVVAPPSRDTQWRLHRWTEWGRLFPR